MKYFLGEMTRTSTTGYYKKGDKVIVSKNIAETCYRLDDERGNSIIPPIFIKIIKEVKK